MTLAGGVLKLALRNLCVSLSGYPHFGGLMSRFLHAVWMVCALGAFSGQAHAAPPIPDNGPPYTDAQFLELAKYVLPTEFRRNNLENWWSRAPGYLRQRVLNAPSHMWWPIIECNFMGFKPEGQGNESAAKCEKQQYENSQRTKGSWKDGEWVGPSEECVKRDKRSQWGELICD